MFQLTEDEADSLRFQFGSLEKGLHSSTCHSFLPKKSLPCESGAEVAAVQTLRDRRKPSKFREASGLRRLTAALARPNLTGNG